jgi:hypothetical protein
MISKNQTNMMKKIIKMKNSQQSDLLQVLMDADASINNSLGDYRRTNDVDTLIKQTNEVQAFLLEQIKQHRKPEPPFCYGLDDCSTASLSVCSWRDSCGSPESLLVYMEREKPKS